MPATKRQLKLVMAWQRARSAASAMASPPPGSWLAEDVRAPGRRPQGNGMVQVGRRGDHHDLGPRGLQKILPAAEDAGHAVAIGERLGGYLVALAESHHATALTWNAGIWARPYPSPMMPTAGADVVMSRAFQ
jgi:hypothetical protein